MADQGPSTMTQPKTGEVATFLSPAQFSFIGARPGLLVIGATLERTRAEIEFVSGLLIGGAAQARGVIDAVGARSR